MLTNQKMPLHREKDNIQTNKEINTPSPISDSDVSEKDHPGKHVVEVSKQFSFSGPIPPPQILEHYERILPGAAGRILGMAEKQSAHRQNMEKQIIHSETSQGTMGMIFAFFIAITAIAAGVFLIYSGKQVAGLISLLTPVGIIVASFISRKKLDHKEK